MHRRGDRSRSRAYGRTLRAEQRQISIAGVRRPPTRGQRRRKRRSPSAVLAARRCPPPAVPPPVPLRTLAPPAPNLAPAPFSGRRAPPLVGDRFIVAGFGVGVQGDRKTAGKLRAVTLVATDRPSSQQLSLIDPKKL